MRGRMRSGLSIFSPVRRCGAGHIPIAFGILCLAVQPACAHAAKRSPTPETVEDLQSLSIDQLANLKVTSVSKRPETLSETAAAIFVITADDIRRAGATSLPEALRLAPNLEVARLNAYSWTITARGFNSPETANKLLVLVDGRSVYEPIGSGVLWEQVDVDMANIDRIEVISGPGGTMWGANAVNGVINVISKDTATTQGLYMQTTEGAVERNASIHFGGKLGQHAHFRVFADSFAYDETQPAQAGISFNDAVRGTHGGLAIDGAFGVDSYNLKAGIYRNTITDWGDLNGYNLLTGWTHQLANGSAMTLQASLDHDERTNPVLYESRDTLNINAQHTIAVGTRQQIVWGGEFHYWRQFYDSYVVFRFADPKTTISLGSVFAQDEIALYPDLKLTLGLKAENSSYSGFDWLPNVRLAWQADDDTLIWGAISQAVRTPNRVERELEWTGVLPPSPDFQSEKLTAYEAGWRAQPTRKLSLSLSAYYNIYDDLRTETYTPGPILPISLANGGHGVTYGLEGWGKYEMMPGWRLSAGFNLLHKDFKLKPGYNDFTNLAVAGQDPDYQAQVRSEWNISDTVEVALAFRRVGKVDTAPVPAYSEADAHLGWRVTKTLMLAVDGLNLLNPRHLEAWDPTNTPPRYIPRSIFATLRYGF